ncbi:hypothetical protein GGS24DRAFT_495666 [Hypoxylon argillaceum]|nr:hypothetical protein GGS24DRAFT_495666 [Hypoxylon argillaceum]
MGPSEKRWGPTSLSSAFVSLESPTHPSPSLLATCFLNLNFLFFTSQAIGLNPFTSTFLLFDDVLSPLARLNSATFLPPGFASSQNGKRITDWSVVKPSFLGMCSSPFVLVSQVWPFSAH